MEYIEPGDGVADDNNDDTSIGDNFENGYEGSI